MTTEAVRGPDGRIRRPGLRKIPYDADVVGLYAELRSLRKVAEHYGVSHQAVSAHLDADKAWRERSGRGWGRRREVVVAPEALRRDWGRLGDVEKVAERHGMLPVDVRKALLGLLREGK